MSARIPPPRWAVVLLRAVLPDGTVGASVRADLDEESHEIAAERGRTAARVWYGCEALEIAAHFTWGAIRSIPGREQGAGMDRLAQNVRIGLRRVRRAPGFSVVAIATIALGIGANVAIFLLPAVHGSGAAPAGVLRTGGRGTSSGGGTSCSIGKTRAVQPELKSGKASCRAAATLLSTTSPGRSSASSTT